MQTVYKYQIAFIGSKTPPREIRHLPLEEIAGIPNDAIGIELQRITHQLTDRHAGMGATLQPRVLERQWFGDDMKTYAELHTMGVDGFPDDPEMMLHGAQYVHTRQGWKKLDDKDEVIIECYFGSIAVKIPQSA